MTIILFSHQALHVALSALVFVCLLQVALCFSPVGYKLRDRSRKFPAVVNVTAIDWFHEWPQEALESVSFKFLQKVKNIEVSQENVFVYSNTNPKVILKRSKCSKNVDT